MIARRARRPAASATAFVGSLAVARQSGHAARPAARPRGRGPRQDGNDRPRLLALRPVIATRSSFAVLQNGSPGRVLVGRGRPRTGSSRHSPGSPARSSTTERSAARAARSSVGLGEDRHARLLRLLRPSSPGSRRRSRRPSSSTPESETLRRRAPRAPPSPPRACTDSSVPVITYCRAAQRASTGASASPDRIVSERGRAPRTNATLSSSANHSTIELRSVRARCPRRSAAPPASQRSAASTSPKWRARFWREHPADLRDVQAEEDAARTAASFDASIDAIARGRARSRRSRRARAAARS